MLIWSRSVGTLLDLSRPTQVGRVVVGLDAIDVIYSIGFVRLRAVERERHQAVHHIHLAYPIHNDPHFWVSFYDSLRHNVARHIEHMSMGRGRVARHPWDRTFFASLRCNSTVHACVDLETAEIRERLAAVGAVAYVITYVRLLVLLEGAQLSRRVYTADMIACE